MAEQLAHQGFGVRVPVLNRILECEIPHQRQRRLIEASVHMVAAEVLDYTAFPRAGDPAAPTHRLCEPGVEPR